MKILMVLLAAVSLIFLSNSVRAPGVPLTCTDCASCTAQIQAANSGDVVQLIQNIPSYPGPSYTGCINFGGKDDITFDCLGNTIDGGPIFVSSDYGIWLNGTGDGSNNNTIKNCLVTRFYYGIYLRMSSNNTITNVAANSNNWHGMDIDYQSNNNTLTNITANSNSYYGVFLGTNSNNRLTNVVANSNVYDGVFLSVCNNHTVTNVTASFNTYGFHTDSVTESTITNVTANSNVYGVYVRQSSNNMIMNVTASFNAIGLWLESSSDNTFRDVTANSNNYIGVKIESISSSSTNNIFTYLTANSNTNSGLWLDGITFDMSSNNTFTNSIFSHNQKRGIYFYGSPEYNKINNSRIENNTNYGVYFEWYTRYGTELYPRYNILYNNIFNNTVNFGSNNDTNQNYWNITLSCTGPNILGEPLVGGNYWSNLLGNGFSDTCIDSDIDGICDSNYTLGTNNTDYLPLSRFHVQDTTPPNTNLDEYLSDPTNDNTPTYTGTATDSSSNVQMVEYRYRLGAGAWSGWLPAIPSDGAFDCSPSEEFTFTPSALADGTYTFETRAIDHVCNWETSYASDTLTIDATEPNTILNAYMPDPTNDNTPTYTGTVTDSSSNIQAVQYRINGGAWQAASPSDGAFNSPGEDFTFTTSVLADGTYTFETRAQDLAGNWETSYGSDTLTIQGLCTLQSATINLNDGNSNGFADIGETVSMSGQFAGDCSAAKFFQIDALGSGCAVQYSDGDISGISNGSSLIISGGYVNGTWTIISIAAACSGKTVSATAAGLYDPGPPPTGQLTIIYSPSVTGSFTFKDVVEPNTILNAYVPDPTTDNTPTYTGTATDSSSNIQAVQYRINGGTWLNAQPSDGAFNSPSEGFTFTTSPLADGTYTFETRAQNTAGNWETSYGSDTLTISTGGPTPKTCTDCASCTAQIQAANSGDIVQLITSISDYPGTNGMGCINFGGKDNVMFDCLGNAIEGDDSGQDYGIWLNQTGDGSNNNTIRNCVVTDFYYGLYLRSSSNNNIMNVTVNLNNWHGMNVDYQSNNNILTNIMANSNYIVGLAISSSNNTITNVTTNSNGFSGFYLEYTSNNTLTNITTTENSAYDMYIRAPYDSDCTNTISNVTGSGNRPIKYFNSPVNLADEVLSELILCNADNSNITNITVIGSESINNNGILVLRTDHSNFNGINSSYRYSGLFILNSPNNTITNVTTNWNSWHGFYLYYSSNNTISNLTALYNLKVGIYLSTSSQYNTLNNSRIENNAEYGIFLAQGPGSPPIYNILYNNYLSNSVNFGSDNSNNQNWWNVSMDCSAGQNIIGGSCIGGNYWTSPSRTGFSDMCADSNSDGICDSPYPLGTNNVDYLPLSQIFTEGPHDLAWFSTENLHIQIGKSAISKVHVRNPDEIFGNITLWLGGNYPTDFAKFASSPGVYFSADRRTAIVGLNPKEQKVLILTISSTEPKEGGYLITLNANTTASDKLDYDLLKVFIGYPPNFPGLDFWGVFLLVILSGFAYLKIKK